MKLRRPILTAFFSSVFFVGSLGLGVASTTDLRASVLDFTAAVFKGPDEVEVTTGVQLESTVEPDKTGQWSFCDYEVPALPQYNVELESVSVDEAIEQSTVFMVDMTFKNTGDTRLFSLASGCSNVPMLSVGTQKSQDRDSLFGATETAMSGWVSGNRIQMSDLYADPGQSFHVTFQSIAPAKDELYREFFQPVVEGIAWIGETFTVDIPVGAVTDQMKDDINFVSDVSMGVADLTGLERNIIVDLSDQMMYARFGETTTWSMQISSGAWDHPTPPGNYEILTKQELRIGSKSPHYRMPYFQLWDYRGYGIHALPYLANDGGTFWTEALTHIGVPVSHGCIRTLPDDAVKMYEFTDIGTPIVVQK